MPPPPNPDIFDKVKFITNYYWQGCEAPFSLYVEMSQAPRGDLWLLLFSLDFEDIAKAWLRPGSARMRKPSRHGRKRPFRNATLDINELVGGRFRHRYGPYPGIALPGAKALFYITDQIDRVNWTAAVVEGVTDVAFDTLWGILTMHPELCPQMSFVDAERIEPQTIAGVAPPTLPIGFTHINSKQGFEGPIPWVFTDFNSDFTVTFTGNVSRGSPGDVENFRYTLRTDSLGVIAESSHASFSYPNDVYLSLTGEVPAGEFAYIARTVTQGSVLSSFNRLFAFGGTML